MKQTLAIFLTILILFVESLLLEIDFITKNPLRVAIVVLLFIITIYIGFRFVQVLSTQKPPEN
ncbi:hypothetical protein [Leeuwenhoekiella sp. LLG6367-2.1]|uniref:hypothetical protein n=1 Tax=Leeuwenhoekiella sp. LLG6367-2.1 TaxID=3160833 RepID=UPI003867592C